jgi:hypothetical protein
MEIQASFCDFTIAYAFRYVLDNLRFFCIRLFQILFLGYNECSVFLLFENFEVEFLCLRGDSFVLC